MKKEIKTEITKEKIIAAAIDEFGANGYYGASLNSICLKGIAKGLLYHNFENKDALYLACVKRSFDEITEYLENENIGTDFHKYTEKRLAFFRQHEKMQRIFFEAVMQPPRELSAEIADLRSGFDEMNLRIYCGILDSLDLRSGITKADALKYFSLAQNMLNSCSGISNDSKAALFDVDGHEKAVSTMIDIMPYGIAERSDEK